MIQCIYMCLLFLVLALLSPVDSALAAKHALLIGVGRYPYLGEENQLFGPPQDVAALKRVLTEQFNFPENNIVTLVDAAAESEAIKKALHDLIYRSKAGDLIFLYFSGHGTSAYDNDSDELAENIDPNSGALIPYDFTMTGSIEDKLNHLIRGNVDIKPVLLELDRDREVFVAFDACYSGTSVRSFSPTGSPKYRFVQVDWPAGSHDKQRQQEDWNATANQTKDEYPYKHVVYISASSKFEKAIDVESSRTYDGKWHGALTNALLEGLKGLADTNGDNTISRMELYQFVRQDVSQKFSHTPQLLYCKSSPELLEEPIFRSYSTVSAPAIDEDVFERELRVSFSGVPQSLVSQIGRIPGVRIVEDSTACDVILSQNNGVFALYIPGGHQLVKYDSFNSQVQEKLLERIKRQVKINQLIAYTPQQTYNTTISLVGTSGVLIEGDKIGFDLFAEEAGYFLLLDFAPYGEVHVLYPVTDDEARCIPTKQHLPLFGDTTVYEPFGTEYLKLISFKKKPKELNRMIGASFLPKDPQFKMLQDMLRANEGNLSQMTLQIKTSARKDIITQ